MKYVTFIAVFLCAVSASCLFSTARADDLIYANDDYTSYVFPPGAYVETFDWGRTSGGLVSRITFRYRNSGSPARIIIRFYTGIDTRWYDPGFFVKQITLNNVPNTGGFYEDYTHVLTENERFTLPGGEMGYSFECSSNYVELGLASGGMGNVDEMWFFDSYWSEFLPFGFEESWAGFYMKIYKAPPIELVTCDISGYKFDDVNGNGVRDAGEAYMPGWDIYLDTNNDGAYQASEPNAVTDPNGMYLFKHLPAPATYRVREVMQEGWTQTLPGGPSFGYVLAAEPNNIYTGRHFGNTQAQMAGTISGMCFNDLNENAHYDMNEVGLANWIVYIDANKNGKRDAGELAATTGSTGTYQLTGVPLGTHVVAVVMQYDWVGTYPTEACTHSVTLSVQNADATGIDFGNSRCLTYGGGQGTISQPYLIRTPVHLQAVGAHKSHWNKHFKLMADISLSKYKGEDFNLIGRYNFQSQLTPFSGTFDGNGFCIRDFTHNYTGTPQEYIGLFGYVQGPAAAIRNLTLSNVNVNTQGGGVDTGAMVGWLRGGTLTHCVVEGGSVRTDSFAAGGMVGSSDGIITDCRAAVTVASPESQAGGLVGGNYNGVVADCSAEGTVSGRYGVGGLVGANSFQVHHCFAVTDATGSQYVGGLVGENAGGSIWECYSQGVVRTVNDPIYGSAGTEAGGLVGRNVSEHALISDCYSEAAVAGGNTVGGLVGASINNLEPCYVVRSYSVGAVTGTSAVGGLIGTNMNSVVTGCFWDVQTSGRGWSAAGIGKTTGLMQNINTYQSAEWDLVGETANGLEDTWRICSGVDYPRLRWTLALGDLDCPDGVGMEDLAYLAGRWLEEGASAAGADINGDGIVNMADFAVLPAEWYGETAE